MGDRVKDARDTTPTATATAGIERPRLTSSVLLQGHNVIEIEHRGEIYRLQLTRQGKLILTK
jgi:hemin uptake protein HemP